MPVLPPNLTDLILELSRRIRVLEGQSYTFGAEDTIGVDLTIDGLDPTVFYNVDELQQIISAGIHLDWTEIVSDPDDGSYDPVHYEVRYSVGDDHSWRPVRQIYTNEVDIDGLPLGTTIYVQLRAVTQAGRRGDWAEVDVDTADDGVDPEQPSTPVATGVYQGVRVAWDGLDHTGSPMSPIFSHIEVHISQTTGFTPSSATRAGMIFGGAGATTIGVGDMDTWYVKLIAVDRKGATSSPSSQGSADPTEAPPPDDMVDLDSVQTLDNKLYKGPVFTDDTDATKKMALLLSGVATGTTRNWTLPNVSDTFVGLDATQVLTGKTYQAPVFCDPTTPTKKVALDMSSNAAGTHTWAVPDTSLGATFVGTLLAQKLESKRIKQRVTTFTTGGARTVDLSTENMITVTALALATAPGVPSGTADEGDIIWYRYKDNGTARAITWNAIYRAQAGTGQALPTTTTVGRTLYVEFIYNATDTKWDLVRWFEV